MDDTPSLLDGVRRARRAPDTPISIKIPLDQDGKLPSEAVTGSIHLTIETTNAGGEHPYWFDDTWWADVITRWADEAVTVIIAPTPSAVLHPVLLYQLEMLRRVVPGWRLVGVAYRTDIDLDQDIRAAATSPYHEFRIIDSPRPGSLQSDRRADRAVESLLASLRREQSAANATSPVLVRLPAGGYSPRASDIAMPARESASTE